MDRYLIESPHTKEECLKALDEVSAQGPEVLSKYNWGCMSGEHAGFAIVDVPNESAARNMVPSMLRNKAHIVKVGQFTPQQIASLHK